MVGSHLLLELCKKGEPVRAIFRNRKNLDLVQQIFMHYDPANAPLFDRIEWVEGDINDVVSLEDAFAGVDKVYHCAALVSFNKRDRDDLMKINAEGTANVVNACLDANIKKLCYVSSTAAIGKGEEHKLLDEKAVWVNTPDISNYSISKHLAEQEVWRGIEEGLNAVIVNPCVIIGPHNWNTGSTFMFKNTYKGLKFYTPGSNAVVDVRVVVQAMLGLMESDIHSERFLVISENLPFKELFTRIANALHKKPPHIRVNWFMANMGRRFENLRAMFTGSEPRITKETVQSAFKNYSFSNAKLKKALPDLDMGEANEAIANAAGFIQKQYIRKP